MCLCVCVCVCVGMGSFTETEINIMEIVTSAMTSGATGFGCVLP